MSISCLYPVRFTSQCFHGCIHVCRDRSHRIVNPDFNANNGNGWSGTSFTAASAGVAEFWNETFDKYQDLADMPAGKYRLEVQGFCRYCYQAESRAAHDNGSERLLACYYMNTADNPFHVALRHHASGGARQCGPVEHSLQRQRRLVLFRQLPPLLQRRAVGC